MAPMGVRYNARVNRRLPAKLVDVLLNNQLGQRKDASLFGDLDEIVAYRRAQSYDEFSLAK